MKNTNKLNLMQPELEDEIHNTINGLSDNFKILDDVYIDKAESLSSYLTMGDTYDINTKLWNSSPSVGDYIGWVNVRSGKFGYEWQSKKQYVLGDVVVPTVDNGHCYICISGGRSSTNEPAFPVSDGSEIKDLSNANIWQADQPYNLNDIVIATNGNDTYYFECITAGVTDTVEPDWILQEGTTIVDNTVTWYVHRTVTWKENGTSCLFRPFGKIF